MSVQLIEEVVFPICAFEMRGELANAKRLLGSGFFIDGDGHFLTAGHVATAFEGTKPGLFYKPDPINQPHLNRVAWIVNYEVGPSDLAIGKVLIQTDRHFDQIGAASDIWTDVLACGYAESSVLLGGDRFISPLRGLKGYIQRTIPNGLTDDLPVEGKVYELSFPVPKGMSGSPLYRRRAEKLDLIGVCVASRTAEMVDFENLSVDENGNQYNERKVRIEQYGVATAIETALDWTPEMVGRPLRELMLG